MSVDAMERPGSQPNGARPPMPPSHASATSTLTRAQRFESEKERIQESCFAKLDENGQNAESYITHLRVEEDALYPSVPPPADSAAEHKKPRVIVVAVRKTGRVRMHKARENQGGSFSIGKTWNLEDLTTIESFNYVASNADMQRRLSCERAGAVGFVVTLVKPYYWAANTAKERDFFIASLVKIFKKYTKGREPHLIGFSDKEKETLFGHAPSLHQTAAPPSPSDATPPQSAFTQSQYSRPPSRDAFSRTVSSDRASPALPISRPLPPQLGSTTYSSQDKNRNSPDLGLGTDHSRNARRPSRENLPTTDSLTSSRSQGRLSPQSSRSDIRAQRSESPATSIRTTSSRTTAASAVPRPQSPQMPRSFRSTSPMTEDTRANGSHGTRDRWKPVALDDESPNQSAESPDPHILPERKRPPMITQDSSRSQYDSEMRPSPLTTASRTPLDRKASGNMPSVPTPSSRAPRQKDLPTTTTPAADDPNLRPAQRPKTPEQTLTDPVLDIDDELESHRPGLESMVKKKTAASQFRKAANAVNAFKPRARAGQDSLKILTSPRKDDDAKPSFSRNVSYDTSRPEFMSRPGVDDGEMTPLTAVSSDYAAQAARSGPGGYGSLEHDDTSLTDPVPDPQRPKLRSRQQEKYLTSLGIDSSLLNGKCLDFETCLSDFGWSQGLVQAKDLINLEDGLRKELGRVEAGTWLGHLEHKDERVDMIDKLLDRAIAECDELDGLLTIYSVELGTLNDDIAFIEAQSQGLQVQTANQKILQSELQTLVGTISIDARQLQPLQRGSFDTDFEEMEQTLIQLHKAMITLDPSVKHAGPSTSTQEERLEDPAGRTELANMHALKEKRAAYQEESTRFSRRLMSRLESRFDSALGSAIPALLKLNGNHASWQLQPAACNAARTELWRYSPMLLFVKEMAKPSWTKLLTTYGDIAAPLYLHVFRSAIDSHKKLMRVATGEELGLLFTSAVAVEKEAAAEGLAASATRKLTMKKSQTLAKSFRSTSAEKASNPQPGRKMPYETFNDMLSSWAPVMVIEQNFVVKLFHATSLQNPDLADMIDMQPPDARGASMDLKLPMPMEPDRPLADQVTRVMEKMFDFWPNELRSLVDNTVATEPIQVVGILASIAVYSFPLHEKSNDFLLRSLNEASVRLQSIFQKFIDEQIRAVEDTKVKIKKRRGVISFIRIFPHFAMAVENMFATITKPAGMNASVQEVRRIIDDAYERIAQSMWASLKQIAKDTPSAAGVGAGASTDADDKESLNHNVLLVENFDHFASEIDVAYAGSVLDKWRSKALQEREEHLDQYLQQVIRRPLGKLLEFVESTEAIITQLKQTTTPASSISTRPSHSRSAAKKAISGYDGKEIRKGIEVLRKRIEKHFGEGDNDDVVAQRLINFVMGETANEYVNVLERVHRINRKVYAVDGEKGLEIEWTKHDVSAAFGK